MSWDTCHNINYTEPTIGGTSGGVSVTLTGDVTGSGASPITTTISANAVTFAKFQQIATSRLLGRSTAGTGNVEELTIGSGLSLAGGVLSASGSGTVTSVSVTSANGVSGSVATATTTPAITLTLGAITPTSVNGLTISTTTGTLTLANGKTLTANNTITLAGTDATVMTFPTTSATIARTDAANTFTGIQTFNTAIAIGSGGTGATTANAALNALLPSQAANSGKVLSTNGTDASWVAAGGTGTVTSVSVVSANGVSGSVATATTTPAITLTLGAITPTSVNGLTISTTTGTLTVANGKTLTANNTITLAGTDATVMTFPTTSATIARTDAAQTFTGVQTFSSTPSGAGFASAATASTAMLRDANGNTNLVNALLGYATTATAGGTTVLTVSSAYTQIFTGTLAQTVTLPTTSVVQGQAYYIINKSTGLVTVQSSGANTIVVLAANTSCVFVANVATPTTAANWNADYSGVNAASGKVATINNTITFAGTDATTMTFPTTSATIARTDAAQTFTGVQTFSSTPAGAGFASAATASTAMLRDANGNTNLVNLLEGYATTATAAGTTTLTVSSAKNQYFTGSTTQTVTMPVTSTLVLGQEYVITNNSTGNVTVQSSGANSIVVVAQNQTAVLTCILTSGTTAASWNFRLYATTVGGYTAPTLGTTSIASGATVTTINGLTLTTTTMTASTNVLGGVTMTLGSDQNGDMYFRQGGVLTRIPLGAAGSFLKSAGGIPTSGAPYSVSSQSVDYTLVLADASSVLYLTGSVARSFTVPPNSTAAFAIGTVITFYQDGTGALTIVAGAGVTIRSEYGLILNTQYSVATITKIATDTWILGGSLRVS